MTLKERGSRCNATRIIYVWLLIISVFKVLLEKTHIQGKTKNTAQQCTASASVWGWEKQRGSLGLNMQYGAGVER